MKRLILIIFAIFAVIFALPVIATVVLSFYGDNGFTLKHYADLLFDCFVFYPMFQNSVIYAAVITAVQFLITIPCAFGFSQSKFKGKSVLYTAYIILMMMPLQVTILPSYIGLRDMGLIDTKLGIILPMIFSPFGVIVMHQYMKSIDNNVIEALRLETSSVIRIMITAVVPQIKICIFAVIVFVFAECFNMVEQPMLFLKNSELQTLSVFIANAEKYSGEVMFPAAVIFMIPIFLIYLFFDDTLENGLTLGEMK